MANSATYNRDYYLKNKESISKRKKTRYQTDPEYRKAALERRAQQRIDEKEERGKHKHLHPAARPPKRMKIILKDGTSRVTDMYSLGQVAYRMGISPITLRKWESQKILPVSAYRSKGGHRLYTQDEFEIILRVYKQHSAANERWSITREFTIDLQSSLDFLTQGLKPLTDTPT